MSTKNSMPSFAQGTMDNLQRLYADEKLNAPAFCYVTDKECLSFLDVKGEFHIILWDKLDALEKKVESMDQSIGDITESIPEGTNLVEYVTSVSTQVNEVSNSISMITSKDLSNEEVTE